MPTPPCRTPLFSPRYVVHAGIKDGAETIRDIEACERHTFRGSHLTPADKKRLGKEKARLSDIMLSALWSDPDPTVTGAIRASPRGAGYLFGERHARSFLKRNNMSLIVRSHQQIPSGYDEPFGATPGPSGWYHHKSDGGGAGTAPLADAPCCVTIFSASNVSGIGGGRGL